MRILLVESHPGVGCQAAELLQAAGHEVATCHDESSGSPCRVFDEPSTCPLEHGAVDVALVVHESGSVATAPESGVGCARRARVPVVVCSRSGHPFGPFVSEVQDDVVSAVEDAVRGRMPEHEKAARDMVLAAPAFGHHDKSAVDVEVRRDRERLKVRVVVPASVPVGYDPSLADRAVRGVRSFDRMAAIIDAAVEHRD
jgi:hypothetical protein